MRLRERPIVELPGIIGCVHAPTLVRLNCAKMCITRTRVFVLFCGRTLRIYDIHPRALNYNINGHCAALAKPCSGITATQNMVRIITHYIYPESRDWCDWCGRGGREPGPGPECVGRGSPSHTTTGQRDTSRIIFI